MNSKDFILCYNIIKDKIIVKYANVLKENSTFNYSIDKENEIIMQMEKQLKYKDRQVNYIKKEFKDSCLWTLLTSLFIAFNIVLLTKSLTDIVAWLAISLAGIINYFNVKDLVKEQKILKELKVYSKNIKTHLVTNPTINNGTSFSNSRTYTKTISNDKEENDVKVVPKKLVLEKHNN